MKRLIVNSLGTMLTSGLATMLIGCDDTGAALKERTHEEAQQAKEEMREIKEEVRDAGQEAKEEAREAKEEIKNTAQNVKEDVKDASRDLKRKVDEIDEKVAREIAEDEE